MIKLFEHLEDIDIHTDHSMAEHTYFRAGGPAEILIEPHTIEAAADVIAICHEQNIPLEIMGRGSNVLVADKGIPGVTLMFGGKMAKSAPPAAINYFWRRGCASQRLVPWRPGNSLTGLEFACGIPGSIGGALRMNAGAYDGCFENIVIRTQYVDREGTLGWPKAQNMNTDTERAFLSKLLDSYPNCSANEKRRPFRNLPPDGRVCT